MVEQKQNLKPIHGRRQNSGTPKTYFIVLAVAALVSILFVLSSTLPALHVDGYGEQQDGRKPYPRTNQLATPMTPTPAPVAPTLENAAPTISTPGPKQQDKIKRNGHVKMMAEQTVPVVSSPPETTPSIASIGIKRNSMPSIFADVDSSIFHFDHKPTCPPKWLPYKNSNEMHPSFIWLYTNLTNVLDSNSIPHSLAAGMLLALERSNYTKVFMPWDDDFDVVVDTSLKVLTKLLDGHPILDNQRPKSGQEFGKSLKLAYKDRSLQSGVSKSSLKSLGTYDYPAIDVFIKSNWKKKNMGPMHFPTKQVKVGKYSLSIPESPQTILDTRYGIGEKGWRTYCQSLKWNHGAGRTQKNIANKCENVFAQCGYTDFHAM